MLILAERSTDLPLELVEWPDQEGLRKALAIAGIPRVLLVRPDVEPPTSLGVDEDWVHADASDEQVEECGGRILQKLTHDDGIVALDDRIWSVRGQVFRLTPLLARIFAELTVRRGTAIRTRSWSTPGGLVGPSSTVRSTSPCSDCVIN